MKIACFSASLVTCFLVSIVMAQPAKNASQRTMEEMFQPKMPTDLDTLYFPFYNGVQMIEVDYIGHWDRKIFFLEQSQPRAMPHAMFHPMPIGNVYFFRDTTGTIVKAFNTSASLAALNEHFKNIPIQHTRTQFPFLKPYHSNQKLKEGVWYQSPQGNFNFPGHYKVSTGSINQMAATNDGHGSSPSDIKFGLIDSLGTIILPLIYNDLLPYYKHVLAQKDNKWGLINYQNEVLVPFAYDSFDFDSYDQAFSANTERNVFFLRNNGKENYNPKYSYGALFLPKSNTLITLNNYDALNDNFIWDPKAPEKRFVPVSKNGKKGLLDHNFQEIVAPQFEVFDFYRNGPTIFRVAQSGKFGFWDIRFQEVIPLAYDYAENFQNDATALVLKDGVFFRINQKNEKQLGGDTTPNWKISHMPFVAHSSLVHVHTGDLHAVVNKETHEMALPFCYINTLSPLGIQTFLSNNSAYFKQQQMALAEKPSMIDELLFHQNRILVKNHMNQYGVMDSALQMVLPFQYTELKPILENLDYLLYQQQGRVGVIDYSGVDLFPESYEGVRYDTHYAQEWDIFKVKKEGKWGVVNFQNETILPCVYDSIRFLGHWNRPKEKLWAVSLGGKFGVVNKDNATFIPFVYRFISHLEGNNLWVKGEGDERYKVIIDR